MSSLANFSIIFVSLKIVLLYISSALILLANASTWLFLLNVAASACIFLKAAISKGSSYLLNAVANNCFKRNPCLSLKSVLSASDFKRAYAFL